MAITYERHKRALEDVRGAWGEGVVNLVLNVPSIHMPYREFLLHCAACGNNWSGMLLSGVKELREEVWQALPEDLAPDGMQAFTLVCELLILLGVDPSAD